MHILVLSQEGKRRKLDESPDYKIQSMFQNANMLAGLAYEQLGKEAKIDDAELQKYYDAHKAEFERVHARHILIRVHGIALPVRPGQKDLTRSRGAGQSAGSAEKIEGGADFAALATRRNPTTRNRARTAAIWVSSAITRWCRPSKRPPSRMKPGELSEPVKTPFGYHLIKVRRRDSKSFEDAEAGNREAASGPNWRRRSWRIWRRRPTSQLDPKFFGQRRHRRSAAPSPPAAK